MRRSILAITAAALVLAVGALLSERTAVARMSGWLTSYDTAAKRAAKREKPMLVLFSKSDASETCQKLTKKVFRNSKFQGWARKNVILLNVDFPEGKSLQPRILEQNLRLREKFEVKTFPTVLLVNAEGEALQTVPYDLEAEKPVETWLETASTLVESLSGGGEWVTDWDEARKQSRATGRPILADFTGSDWCGWCKRLKAEVFDTPEFKTWAAKKVVLLELDYPRTIKQADELKRQNQELKQKYGIRGYPTVLFLDARGKELGRSGYLAGGPEKWTEDAEKKLR